jgi:IPT/TIG domain-containing protein
VETFAEMLPHIPFSRWRLIAAFVIFLFASITARAGGPKYVAGVSYFNPSVMGQPIIWPSGQVKYFVDQGPLGPLSNTQAVAMVDAAAAIWSEVPTAAVNLIDAGTLAEDVNGSNVFAGNGFFYAPTDVAPTATATPVAVIFDSDGSVFDALEGAGASEPDNCSMNSLLVWIDNMTPSAALAHGVIVLNGRCATTANLITMMSYQLERAFGRILGLDFSQVNPNAIALASAEPSAILGWPVMEPLNGECGAFGGDCIPNPNQLRLDDVAALNRLYPVTTANLAGFPGKMLTAANTVSIQGTINFRSGQGMQGVNVVARPLDANGNPLYQDTVTFVSGAYFAGNRGNPVTGWTDANGNRLDRFGSNQSSLEGFFDLRGIPLPTGVTKANYQITFEAVSPLYIDTVSVGPYLLGTPTPSGSLPTLQLNARPAGSAQTLTVNIADSAAEYGPGFLLGRLPRPRPLALIENPSSPKNIGTESNPQPLPPSGTWISRLGQAGQGDWFLFPARANRTFTIVAQALDETGTPSSTKAMPAIGVWDGFDPIGTAAAGSVPAANGNAPGETWLQVSTSASDIVRLAIADQRGDGRPDYFYRGWVLYADTVSPTRLPASGGTIVIRGTGFRIGDTVRVGSAAAQVTSVLPTEITAVVPPAGPGTTGSQDVTVNDLPSFNASAVIQAGLSYDSADGDALTLVTAPSNQVPINVPQPFSVIAIGEDGDPAGGVTVQYSVTSGSAALECGYNICSVTTSGDGHATLFVTATSTSTAVVTAALTNGASLQTHFYGGTPPSLSALTPTLYLAAGATAQWPVQALALTGQTPLAGHQVAWQSAAGITAPTDPVTTIANGTASATLTVGPLAEGQSSASNACLNGTSTCASFNVFGSRPELATLSAVSGTSQSISASATPAPVVLRILDVDGNPMAAGTVTISQALYAWTPSCPRHGRCAQAPLLASQTSTLTSALDGTVTLTPLTWPGIPTTLLGLAATGNTGSLEFAIEQHP